VLFKSYFAGSPIRPLGALNLPLCVLSARLLVASATVIVMAAVDMVAHRCPLVVCPRACLTLRLLECTCPSHTHGLAPCKYGPMTSPGALHYLPQYSPPFHNIVTLMAFLALAPMAAPTSHRLLSMAHHLHHRLC
jgi:hypothetical protein